MKTGTIIISIIISITLTNCNSNKAVFKLKPDFCGDVYIIVLDSMKVKKKIIIDSKGIGYAGRNQLFEENKYVKIEIRQSGKDVTSSCNKVSDGFVNYPNNQSKYNYLYFCKECDEVKCSSSSVITINLESFIENGTVVLP